MVVQVRKIAVKEGVDPKSVAVQGQNAPSDLKEVAVSTAASQVRNTPSGVKESDVPPSVVVRVQDTPSHVEGVDETQSPYMALQVAHEGIRNIKTPGRHVATAMLAAKDGPADLDNVGNFGDTYLTPLRIFDSIIEQIANVWVLLLHRDGLIPFHRYIRMQRWRWARCLAHQK